MNRPELYHKTITTLNDAWRKGELEKGDCSACAVGNTLGGEEWGAYFCTTNGVQRVNTAIDPVWFFTKEYLKKGFDLINASGYTMPELMLVEFAFETAPEVENNERQNQYNGLCAVFDVLQEIHEVEFSVHQESKEALESVYELLN